MSDVIASHLNISLSEKQDLLEQLTASIRMEKVLEFIENDLSVIKVEKKIRTRVKIKNNDKKFLNTFMGFLILITVKMLKNYIFVCFYPH